MRRAAAASYTDWWRGGTRKGSNWEQYELEEVLPYGVALPHPPGRQNHAIGGLRWRLGAPALAARLPSYFAT